MSLTEQGEGMDEAPGPPLDETEVLRAAAIVGESFDVDVLADVVDLPALQCLDILATAIEGRVVEPVDGPELYRFVDAAAHRHVVDAISAGDKVRLHARVAEALGARYGDSLDAHLIELAAHWSAAAVGDYRSRAAGWVSRAADAAAATGSLGESVRLYKRAIDIGRGALGDEQLAELHLALARAAYRCGDVSAAVGAATEAAASAVAAQLPHLVAEAALVVEPTVVAGVNEQVRKACELALVALERAADEDDRVTRIRVLARFADVCHYLGDQEAVDEAGHALDDLRAGCDDMQALATALHAQQLSASGADGLERRDALATQLAQVARALDDPIEKTWSHLWRIDIELQRGDISAAAHEVTRAVRAAKGLDNTMMQWELLRAQAVVAQAQARFDDAVVFADRAEATMSAVGNPIGRFIWVGHRQNICHHTGLTEDFLAALATTAAAGPPVDAPLIVTLCTADVRAATGDRPAAAAAYRSLGPAEHWRPTMHSDLFTWAYGIKVATALDERRDVEVLHARLGRHRGLHVATGAGAVGYFGPVELWLGVASSYLGRYDAAIEDLEQAIAACAANGAAGFQTEAQLHLARTLLLRAAPSDALRARRLAEEAAQRADLLGMPLASTEARALLDQTLPLRSGELTRREREVAVLVGQGLTNRAIANRLHLSERTAANHVQHILDKLQLDNRAQIAMWLSSAETSTG